MASGPGAPIVMRLFTQVSRLIASKISCSNTGLIDFSSSSDSSSRTFKKMKIMIYKIYADSSISRMEEKYE